VKTLKVNATVSEINLTGMEIQTTGKRESANSNNEAMMPLQVMGEQEPVYKHTAGERSPALPVFSTKGC
jgi:hypothetical protein